MKNKYLAIWKLFTNFLKKLEFFKKLECELHYFLVGLHNF